MYAEITSYMDGLKKNTKQQISNLLSDKLTGKVAADAFAFHYSDALSGAFQGYYRDTIDNREAYMQSHDFFRKFKYWYSLQGIDNTFLDRLETEKSTILHLIDNNDLGALYFTYFAAAPLKHGTGIKKKNLGSFFAKLVHTFRPHDYCALDNPIKNYFGLKNESFYVAFIVVSYAYREWARENLNVLRLARAELERNEIGRSYTATMTDLKLLDLVFWFQANRIGPME